MMWGLDTMSDTGSRKKVGLLVSVLIFIFFVGILDGLFAHFRKSPSELHALPGNILSVMGPLPADVDSIGKLKVVTSPENGVRLIFSGIQKGHWLGGTFWRGDIDVFKTAPPGKYLIRIFVIVNTNKPISEFTVFVHEDEKSLRRNFLSLFMRYIGVSPWYVSISALGLAFPLIGYLLFLSSKIDKELLDRGFSEIYYVKFNEDGEVIVAFGFGLKDGIDVGNILDVFDESGLNKVGYVEVKKVFEKDSIGLFRGESDLLPKQNYLVKLPIGGTIIKGGDGGEVF